MVITQTAHQKVGCFFSFARLVRRGYSPTSNEVGLIFCFLGSTYLAIFLVSIKHFVHNNSIKEDTIVQKTFVTTSGEVKTIKRSLIVAIVIAIIDPLRAHLKNTPQIDSMNIAHQINTQMQNIIK